MLRFKAGDVEAFHALYARHRGPLYRYFVRQAAREAADDLYQDTWLRIIKRAASYEAAAPFAAYLYTIAHNVLVDHLRRTGRHATIDLDEVPEPPDPGEPIDALLDGAARKARLRAAIDALPATQREAFMLREEAGLTLEQIAEVVGTSRDTVKSRLRYAVARLRQALAEPADPIERSA